MSNMINNKLILCVILAGGKGSRLDGKGKYSQLLCRRTLLEHVYTRVAAQTSQIAVNFKNKNQSINKKYLLAFDKFKTDIGPLAGIHAAISYCKEHIKEPSNFVVTVPVDTPFIPMDLIARLKNKIETSKFNVIIACSGNRHHPTIAIWKTSVIAKLEKCIRNNVRKIDLFTKELVKGYVSWEINKYDPFFNINNYNDLKFAENMIRNEIIN